MEVGSWECLGVGDVELTTLRRMSNIYKILNSRYGKPSGLTRREMLQRSFAAGAALLISERFTAPLSAGAGRVVVVGAGFSGLAAAYELSARRIRSHRRRSAQPRRRHGSSRSRISCRARTSKGGGELIGSNHPAWVAYAKQFGLQFLDVAEEDLEAPDHPQRQEADRRAVGTAVGGDGEGVQHHRHRRGEGRRRRSRGRRPTPRRSTSGRWPTGSTS